MVLTTINNDGNISNVNQFIKHIKNHTNLESVYGL